MADKDVNRVVVLIKKGSRLDQMLDFLNSVNYGEFTNARSYRLHTILKILDQVVDNIDFLNKPLCDNLGERFQEYLKEQNK